MLQVIYFHEHELSNWLETLVKRSRKITWGNLLRVRPIFTASLPSLDNLGQLLGHTPIMIPFKHPNI